MSDLAAQAQITPRLRVEVTATRESVRFLSHVIDLYCRDGLRLSAEDRRAVQLRLAIVEALTNVARHAYAGKLGGKMTLELERDRSYLVTTVTDRGIGFDPTKWSSGAIPEPERLQEGGYGLGIIRRVMDELAYTHTEDSENRFTMRKHLWS